MGAETRTIDCVFTMLSPWAYIGHAALLDLCLRRGAEVRYRPVPLSTVFPGSGGLPLAERHPSRQAYRLVELQRWRERRGLSFDLQPRHWPFDPSLADRAVVALVRAGADPGGFVLAGFRAVWEEGRDLAEVGEVSRLLAAAGHEPDDVIEAARSDAVGSAYGGTLGAPSARASSGRHPTCSTAKSSGGRTGSTCSTTPWRAVAGPSPRDVTATAARPRLAGLPIVARIV